MEQTWLTLGLVAVVVLALSVAGLGVLDPANLADIGRATGPLLILGTGAALVILGRGIDLSAASVAAVAAQLFVWLVSVQGYGELRAILVCLVVSAVLGLVNGAIIVWGQVPALFVTLATWQLYLGLFRLFVSKETNAVLPRDSMVVSWMGSSNVLGIPSTLLIAGGVVVLTSFVLRFTSFGWFYRAVGDNFITAQLTGIPERPLRLISYVLSSILAGLTGLVLLGVAGSYTTVYGSSEAILFDAITIAIIGGFSLAGGRGNIRGVVVAALLIAVVQNGMTLMNFTVVATTLTKGLILLAAIAVDAWLHPESEETVRAGDL
ncbi:ABC transporter permease [Nocardioides sp. CN2-186]|uniref:ABC transporter permease n=1 Tax=Nocardioides tweenelious TaxID=3156607 RepID=UPI0032B4A5C3